jgi:hypothetical protein
MRSLVLIAAVVAASAGCPSRKPADTQPPSPPAQATAPPNPPPAKADANPPPGRTELDRSPGFVIEQTKPKLVAGAYVWPCPLPRLENATIAIAKRRRLTLSSGSKMLGALTLDDDFYAAETEVTCQKSFVSIRREKDGRFREAGFAWDHGRLAKTARSEGLIPPVRGP